MQSITLPPLRPLRRSCGRAAVIATLVSLSCVFPTAAAADTSPTEVGVLTIHNEGGEATELTGKVTLPQLASVLGVTPAELIAQIKALPGNSAIGTLLNGLIADPEATLQDVLDDLAGGGLEAGPVEQLLNSLLASQVTDPEQLQNVVDTLLADLGLDGQLESLAQQLNVPLEAVEHPNLPPISEESLAGALGTTVDQLGSALGGAGALKPSLGSITPLIAGSLAGPGSELLELIGAPNGAGGVTLTTVGSTTPGPVGPPGPAGTAGAAAAAAPAGSAFSVLSIKLTKGGLIVETVRVPRNGRLSVKATAKGNVASKSRRGRTRTSTKAIRVAPVATGIAAGTRTVTLHPGQAIHQAKRVAVSLTTTYVPTGGSSNVKHNTVTFKGAAKDKRHG